MILRDDLQGEELIGGDAELKITAEAYKAMQEDLKIHNKESSRLDYLTRKERNKVIAEIIAALDVATISVLPQRAKDMLGQ
ncbi:hypothetical protein [Acidaminobacter hydrogenoformans]|uniref:Uncharacterized protein n=1 Tax=Acidaminobacter hydrogenoformans DSM 2784 TaxID=1120920 RepID=A0A1G5S246_9FIRM|nr:hypothetical protein [Acidaminobacter hydrogenoformans]SCZ80383.1 hypothetical protein SAMN03080599_02240 [Acidaminobacter hydrogenoformans DSM 2784]